MAQKPRKTSENDDEANETGSFKLLSTAEIAAEEVVTVQYIARLERAGVISKSGRGKYAASELSKIRAFRAGDPLPGEDSPANLTQERILLVRAQREKVELDLAERRGELQSKAEAAADLVALATAVRNRLLAVPDRVASRIGLQRHDVEVIAEEIRDALAELSKAEATS
jgi:phage terminase Nu1 subunit (DNA packaging protein)